MPEEKQQVINITQTVNGNKSNGLGVAALILSVLALLSCWIPFLGVIGMLFAVVGLLLGVIGIVVAAIRKSGFSFAIAGIIICIISIAVFVLVTEATIGAIETGIADANSSTTRR